MENYERIEKYLEGNLNPQELIDFEQELQKNIAFAKEVEEMSLLVKNLQTHQKRLDLKKQMNIFHTELADTNTDKSANKAKSTIFKKLRTNYYPALAVAASMILIAFIGIFYTLNNVRSLEAQQANYYKALRRDLIEVKEEQKKIANSQKTNQTVRQYGATAFVISSNGYLLTNYHVIQNADSMYIEALQDSLVRFKVETVYKDIKKDLAILQIKDKKFIAFGHIPYTFRNQEADLGEEVYTLAYPRRDMVYGEGSISAKSGYRDDTLAYQISIPVNPGNSGAPLLDEKGNLIGMVSGKHSSMEGAAFAIKARYLKALIDSIPAKTLEKPIILPLYNFIQYLPRTAQIKQLKKFVFIVRVYDGKGK